MASLLLPNSIKSRSHPLRGTLKPNFGHDLGINGLKCLGDGFGMITVVYQNRDLWNIHRFGFEIGNIERKHLNQSLVVSDIGFSAVSEEGKPLSYRQLDAV